MEKEVNVSDVHAQLPVNVSTVSREHARIEILLQNNKSLPLTGAFVILGTVSIFDVLLFNIELRQGNFF